jgi:hypothetical protein
MNTPEGMDTDHKNRDTLDNRKSNLRICSHQLNHGNRTKQSNNSSGYKGVLWHKQRSKWWARIQIKGKQISLGCYRDKDDAARAYDYAALKYFGEFARFNLGMPK